MDLESITRPLVHVFNEASGFAMDSVKDIAHVMVADTVSALITAGVTATAVHWMSKRRARKQMMDGNFKNDHAVFGFTLYKPSGIINPDTGQEFLDQSMRTRYGNIELEKIFQPPHTITLMETILAASKHCTDECPVVFAHLGKVIKNKRELELTQRAIGQYWVNHFATLMAHDTDGMADRLDQRSLPIERGYIPVLTYEPSAETRKFRILRFRAEDVVNNNLPDPANVRVEVTPGHYVRDDVHHYMQRLATNKAIHDYLNSDEGRWLMNTTTVLVPTGKYKKIAAPKLATA